MEPEIIKNQCKKTLFLEMLLGCILATFWLEKYIKSMKSHPNTSMRGNIEFGGKVVKTMRLSSEIKVLLQQLEQKTTLNP